MGLFWDLIQQSQISETRGRAESLEARVSELERQLRHTQRTLHELVMVLEKHFGQDLDRDGRIGG